MPKKHTNITLSHRRRSRVLLALGWYAGKLHQGVAEYASAAGWSLNIEMERHATPPPHWNGDGVICILGMNHPIDELMISWGVPMVSIGPIHRDPIPTVGPDNRAIAKLAFDHFFERGFRTFAMYLRSGGLGEKLRFDAFRREVESAGFEIATIDAGAASGAYARGEPLDVAALGQRIREMPKPLAILAEYDDRGIELIDACEAADIPVPEQVAILGVDNDDLRCDFAPVPLSSIDDDQRMQGYEAARLLDQLLTGEKPATSRVTVKPKGLVTRVSTDILAIEHPHVAAALRVIWNHYTEPLTAGDVADTVPMSNRRLHDAFVRHVGRTISEEIKRRRVEHAQRLLLTKPPRKMEDIAREVGFTSGDRMSKVFAAIMGESPSAYRRAHVGGVNPD